MKKAVSGQPIMHQPREPINYFIDRHHFTMGIAGQNFNCIPFLELEILRGHICLFYTNYSLFLRPFCLHTCSRHFCADPQVSAVQRFHCNLKIISYLERIVQLKCGKTCFFCETRIKISAKILDVKKEKCEGFVSKL